MRFYTTLVDMWDNLDYVEIFENYLDAVAAFKKENPDYSESISVAVVKSGDRTFYVVNKENVYTNFFGIEVAESYDNTDFEKGYWSIDEVEKDPLDIDVDYEDDVALQSRCNTSDFMFISGSYYTFANTVEDLQAILKDCPFYDDKLTLQDILNLERYRYVECGDDTIREYIKSQQ